MPKLPAESHPSGDLAAVLHDDQLVATVALTTQPVLVVGCARKVNTGNFENVDVYAALALPLGAVGAEDLAEAVRAAAEIGFGLTSAETAERYQRIKDLQRGRATPKDSPA